MKQIKDIVYHESYPDDRGKGDLFLPDNLNENTPLVLNIHGGGWGAMSKERVFGISKFLADAGFAVFANNYRLLKHAPWPACGDDCLEAAEFLLHGDIPELAKVKREKIGIVGGSAGGHLALMTGLRFPATRWIVDISGIADPLPYFKNTDSMKGFFGYRVTLKNLVRAFPEYYLDKATCPPILCTHMMSDEVVPISSMLNFAETAAELGITVERYVYEPQPGFTGHGIWRPGVVPVRLFPELEAHILDFIQQH